MSTTLVADLVLDQISAFGIAGLAVLGALIVIIGGLVLWNFAVRKFRGSAGYNYMDSYRNVNFGAVEQAIYRSKGNNSADRWGT